jgi:hypothetical protein
MRRNSLQRVAFSLPLALAACGSVVEDRESPEAVGQAVESEFGGDTTADEAPGFGDEALALPEFQSEDAAVSDMTTDRPELRDARHVRIAVIWGYPRPNPEATTVVDWTGNISVTNAGLRVLRTLRFEDTDVVVRPRTDLHVVEFESQTKPHADGLLLDVVIAPVLNPEGGPITLTFNSAPFTGSLTLQPGMRLNHVETVDDAGHVVAYHIIAPDADGCTEGFLRGRWHQSGEVDGHRLGTIKGRFTAHDGRIRGHLRGVFGVREDGKQVWFAKVIDRDGKFLGLLAGRYGDGKLAALFFTRNDADEKIVKGMVRGVYFDADGDHDGGFFGRYSERCAEDPREGMVTTDEPELTLSE